MSVSVVRVTVVPGPELSGSAGVRIRTLASASLSWSKYNGSPGDAGVFSDPIDLPDLPVSVGSGLVFT